MDRTNLLKALRAYEPQPGAEKAMWEELIAFVEQHKDCLLRSNLKGQVTGSAWIVDRDLQQTLLVHHKKLGKWLQPGGHSDGEADILKVALKEAEEETGLTSLHLAQPTIFDVDVHTIPEHKGIPEHRHYDLRYLFTADINEQPVVSEESNELKWIPLENLPDYNPEESVVRMARKTMKSQGL